MFKVQNLTISSSHAPAPPIKLYDIGQVAHIGEDFAKDDQIDDMGGANHRFYRSEKILGKLYCSLKEKKI